MAFEKIYIGKGKTTPVNSVQCTITKENFDKYAHEYDGKLMLTFEVTEMRQPDQYGKTHTVYVNNRISEPASRQEPKLPAGDPIPETDDLPF